MQNEMTHPAGTRLDATTENKTLRQLNTIANWTLLIGFTGLLLLACQRLAVTKLNEKAADREITRLQMENAYLKMRLGDL